MYSTTKERALATLITQGPMHRADLARALSVSRTTVTNLTQELMSDGVVGSDTGTPLKAKIWVSPAAGVLVSVVFRLRRTVVAVGSVDGRELTMLESAQQPADRGVGRLASARRLTAELLETAGHPRVLAAHVAVNTQIDVRTGEVVGGEASRMWTGVNPLTALQETLGAPVAVENTARLFALTEHLAQTGGPSRNLLYVHISHGIAMGQILRGSIVQGSHGGAGELGHMSIDLDGLPCECANRGCLMQYVDEKAVLIRAQAILGPDATLDDLLAEAHSGSRACRSLIGDVGTVLGRALVGVCHLLDPDVIVVGGTLARAGELLVDPVRRVLIQRALPLNARGLVVTSSANPTPHRTVVAAGLHTLRSDTERVEAMVRAISGVSAPH
ncbi:MAG: ROK family transcriptional regulator [Arachnia sp.]